MSDYDPPAAPEPGPGPDPAPGPTGEAVEPEEPTGRARLRGAILRPSRGQSIVAVLVAVLGFAAVTQARATGADDAYAGLRQDELIQALNGLQAASQRAEDDIDKLETTKSSLQDSNQKRTAALQQAQTEVNTLGILGGTLPASGPGIRVTIQDPHHKLTINTLLDGIEELRDAGAEAMEFNDSVRVVAQTSFEDSSTGDGILIDDKLVTPPYTLDAIGDADTLSKALSFEGGFNDDVTLAGGSTTTKELAKVEVSVTRTPVAPKYAVPVPGQ